MNLIDDAYPCDMEGCEDFGIWETSDGKVHYCTADAMHYELLEPIAYASVGLAAAANNNCPQFGHKSDSAGGTP
jgi:hypothetical protein